MTKFNLSDKIVFNPHGLHWISETNVKEFIKILNEWFENDGGTWSGKNIKSKINETAGDKLK